MFREIPHGCDGDLADGSGMQAILGKLKSKTLYIAAIFVAGSTLVQAQSMASSTRASASESEAGAITVTNSPGETYSLDKIAMQMRELHRVVNETIPMLNAIASSESNSVTAGQQSGGLSGILSGILHRNTNNVASESHSTTNSWGNVLHEILAGNTNASTSASSKTTLNDLTTLRDQLKSLTPLLERLDSGATSTGNLSPTGRE